MYYVERRVPVICMITSCILHVYHKLVIYSVDMYEVCAENAM